MHAFAVSPRTDVAAMGAKEDAEAIFGEGNVQRFLDAFADRDRGGTGTISGSEVPHLLRSNGLAPTELQVSQYLAEAGGPDGKVTTDQVLSFCVRTGKDESTLDELSLFFAPFDPDDKGVVPKHVFRNLMTNVGESFPPEQVDDMIADICGGANEIDYRNFLSVIMQK